MIKNFKRNDIHTTPFVATKPWVLTSFHNDDVLLIDTGSFQYSIWDSSFQYWDTSSIQWDENASAISSIQEVPLAQEFIDYLGSGDLPILNRECNVALEQQVDDKVLYEEGQKLDGPFYVESDPKNNTGTFKRLIYSQIKNAFYNEWNDPTKMFGMENIDFQLSSTRKFLAESFRLFNVSHNYFGEKILENTVTLVDNSLDDNFRINDDGKGNILAKENLFSRVQEVGDFNNYINVSTTSSYCDTYYSSVESRQTTSSVVLSGSNCLPW